MLTISDVRQKMLELLEHRLTLDQFESWLVTRSWNMHRDSARDVMSLVAGLELALSEHSSGHLTMEGLLEEFRRLFSDMTFTVFVGHPGTQFRIVSKASYFQPIVPAVVHV